MPPAKKAAAAPATAQPDPAETTTEKTTATSAQQPKPAASDKAKTATPCPDCFPLGWPDGVEAAGCEHGSWTRDTKS